MTFSIAEQYVRDTIRNRTLVPDGFKWDLSFTNLVYSSNTTKIAFILAIDSAAARDQFTTNDEPIDPSQPEATVTVGTSGRLNWVTRVADTYLNNALNSNSDLIASTLFADTTNMTVTSEDDDVQISETRSLIAFTPSANNQPTTIDWDPTIFVDDQALDNSGAANNFVALSFSLIALCFLGNFF